MIVVFVKNKYILPKDMTNIANEYFFACLPMAKEEKNARKKVVLFMYKNNMQIKKKEIFPLFIKLIHYCYGFSIQLAAADSWYLLVL